MQPDTQQRRMPGAGARATQGYLTGLVALAEGMSPTGRLRQLHAVRLACLVCFDPATLLLTAQRGQPDLIIIHVRLTDDPAWLVGQVHARTASPVLLLIEAAGPWFGADGVLHDRRPLGPQLALLLPHLRGGNQPAGRASWGELTLDRRCRRAWWHGSEARLTEQQFRLLWQLCDARGALVTSTSLSRQLYGHHVADDRLRLMAHIRRIRRLLEDDPAHPRFLLTVRGEGFRLADGDGDGDAYPG
jgi:hypothetical protein